VTSEGVNVYLDVALREVLQIDPTKHTFTVKMTGTFVPYVVCLECDRYIKGAELSFRALIFRRPGWGRCWERDQGFIS
jgi:hypothetical protein